MKSAYEKVFRVVSLLVLLILVSACSKQSPGFAQTDQCYKTFDEFAYVLPEKGVFQEKILPLEPWKVEATLPEYPEKPWSEYVMATRDTESYSEVWVSRFSWGDDPADSAFYEFVVFRTDTKEWRTVSAEVENSGVFVQELFVTKDGDLWGKNGGRSIIDRSPIALESSILSKYNQEIESFEFVDEVDDIPAAWMKNEYDIPQWAEVVLSTNSVFWMFLPHGKIYSYDSVTQKVEYHVELPPYNITQVVMSSDNTFYLKLYDPNSMSFYLEENELFYYDPVAESVQSLDNPDIPWYGFHGILLDKDGRLWLDAEGYREKNGNWHELRPWSLDYYREWIGNSAWRWTTDPYVMMESSDGRIWFAINHPDVSGYKRGIAWFDPRTKSGCWFTSEGDNLVEDSHKNLWLVVEDKLYKYSIGTE